MPGPESDQLHHKRSQKAGCASCDSPLSMSPNMDRRNASAPPTFGSRHLADGATYAFSEVVRGGRSLRQVRWCRTASREGSYTPSALRTSNTSMMRAPLWGPSHTNCQRPSE